jgi:hypothetical protein
MCDSLCGLNRGGLAIGKTAVAIDLTAIDRRELESLAFAAQDRTRIGAAGAHRPSGRAGRGKQGHQPARWRGPQHG